MTWKQLQEAKKLTKWWETLYKELSCREMINSCLCYGSSFLNSRYKDDYIKELWETRVVELYNEQKADFDKSRVLYWVYTDWEWCTYNSIKWYDEE